MKIFVPFSEELFETAGRRARSLVATRAHAGPDTAGGNDAALHGAGTVTADADDGLGELVPFRLDYRCLRLKARPRDHAPHA